MNKKHAVEITKRENLFLQGGLIAQIGSLKRGMVGLDKDGQQSVTGIIEELQSLLSKLKSAEPEDKLTNKLNPFK